MALIVEDGTGKSDSEGYDTVVNCDTYFSNRGVDVWDLLDTSEKEIACRKATDYMEAVYSESWKGHRTFPLVQALSWPRIGIWVFEAEVSSSTIPTSLKMGWMELALKSLSGDLLTDATRSIIKSVIGPIETEYDKNSPQQTSYNFVHSLFSPYLNTSGTSIARLVRT